MGLAPFPTTHGIGPFVRWAAYALPEHPRGDDLHIVPATD